MRLSGSRAAALAATLGAAGLPERRAVLRTLTSRHDGATLDSALCLAFAGPASATGEDVVELHLHGGPALVERIVGELTEAGARLAEPGEFTLRAVLAGRMGLTDAEGLAELLEARTKGELARAARLASGALGRTLSDWRARLVAAMAEVEAHLDFADEDDVGTADPSVDRAIARLAHELETTVLESADADRLTDGFRIALIGPPNAGKSSLLNALAGRDAAIVSATAGTTRDVVSVTLELAGYRVTLSDTAGIRDNPEAIEAMGIARTRAAMAEADLTVRLISPDTGDLNEPADLVVAHKSDLAAPPPDVFAATSVSDPSSIEALSRRLAERVATAMAASEAALLTRARQRQLVAGAAEDLRAAAAANALELKAAALRDAATRLGRLAGDIGVEDVLDDVFSRFCIGK